MLADESGLRELQKLGARSVPVVSKGGRWVNGQAIAELADFVGVPWTHQSLPPNILAERVTIILQAAQRFTKLIPENKFNEPFLDSPRSLRKLAAHVGEVVETFLALVERGKRQRLEDLDNELPHIRTRDDAVAFQAEVASNLQNWWLAQGKKSDFSVEADVYYGKPTLHEFFERTAWHAAQHTRQLQYALDNFGIAISERLTADDLKGLPVPDDVWT